MNVAVCVKQIPDPAVPGQAGPGHQDPEARGQADPGRLRQPTASRWRSSCVDKAGGGEVTLDLDGAQRRGERAAHRPGHGRRTRPSSSATTPCKGTDALATAKVLAAAIKRAEPDLVLAATESTDGYTGTTPVQIAELLGLPSITFAKHIEIADGTVKVNRQTEAGYDEVECPLPVARHRHRRRGRAPLPVVQGDHGGQEQAGRRAHGRPTSASTPAQVGWAGAGQEITDIAAAEERKAGEIVVDEGDGHEQDRRRSSSS